MGERSKGTPDARGDLLDAIATPAFSVDADFRYRAFNRANRAAVRTLYGADIHVGDDIFDMMRDDPAAERLRASLVAALAGETLSQGAWFGSDPETSRYFRFTFAPTYSDGRVDGAAAIAVDETELHRAREALRVSEERFAAAFRASPDAININRLSDGMYLEINQGFTDLMGYTAQDVAGRTSLEISVWANPEDRDHLVAELGARGHVDQLSAEFRRKDGSLRSGEMSAVVVTVAGQQCILSVTRDVTARVRTEAALADSYARLERMSQDMVETLGRVVEARDPYTQGHEKRAAALCRLIAAHMELPEDDVEALETAALVHDIGKLSVPAEILTKPGNLTPTELELVREHPQTGYEILKGIAFERPIAEITLEHHERQDGSGYPRGLEGDEIMMAARILAVADLVEAMSSHRPYRPSLGMEAAVAALRSAPEKYDADVVEALFDLWHEGALTL